MFFEFLKYDLQGSCNRHHNSDGHADSDIKSKDPSNNMENCDNHLPIFL